MRIIANRYRLMDMIGKGGMGEVYLAQDMLKGNMDFAVKTLKQSILKSMDEAAIKSFKNEYEIMARLKHPNLTAVYDFGVDGGNYFIVMEYIKGKILSDAKADPVDIMIQSLRALEYVHSRNIVYRDIKPKNIMISGNRVKLLDFGLSNVLINKDDKIRGTILYLPPEALKKNVGFHMDIFSLGMVIFEFLTGLNFYNILDINFIAGLLRVKKDFENYSESRLENIHDKILKRIVRKMVAYEPEERYKACSEIIHDINDGLGHNYPFETNETKSSYLLGNGFANRTEEIGELRVQIESRKSGLFIYRGPRGVGKTRLFEEFKRACRIQDLPFYDTRCIEGIGKEYSVISEILERLICNVDEKILSRFASYIRMIMPDYLVNFQRIEIKDDPKMMRDIIIENISDFFLEVSTRTNILYFDDIQWIDEGSAEILKAIVYKMALHRTVDLHIFASMEQDIKSDGLYGLIGMEGVHYYDVYPLDKAGMRLYIENVFGTAFIDISLKNGIEEIGHKVGGNPYFLGELIKSLVEEEIIVKDKIFWKLLRPLEEAAIPDNLSGIVENRIRKLFMDTETKKILEILSIVRIELEFDIIKNIAGGPNIAGILIELERYEIIRANGALYSIISGLVKDIIGKGLKDKKRLNLLIAESLEKLNEKKSGSLIEEMAFQYAESGNTGKALFYYEKCADNAQANYFSAKAVRLYDISLGFVSEDLYKRLEITIKKANALENMGRWSEASALLEESRNSAMVMSEKRLLCDINNDLGYLMLKRGLTEEAIYLIQESRTIALSLNDSKRLMTAINHMGYYCRCRSLYGEAENHYAQHIKLALDNNDSREYFLGLISLGNIFLLQSKYKDAVQFYRIASKIAKKNNDKKNYGIATGNIGIVYKSTGELDKAMEKFETCLRISKEIGYKEGIKIATGNLGGLHFSRGELKLATANFEKSLKVSTEIGDIKGIGVALGNLAVIYKVRGEYSKSLECLFEKKRIAETTQDKRGTGIAYNNMGNIYMIQGKYEKALRCYIKRKDISKEIGDRTGLGVSYANIADIYLVREDYDNALKYYNMYRKIARETEDRNSYALATGKIGNVYLARLELDMALKIYRKAIQNSSETGDIISISETYYNMGLIYGWRGAFDKALEYFQQYEDISLDSGDSLASGRLYEALGGLFHQMGDNVRAIDHIKRSLKIFSDCGIKDTNLFECLLTASLVYSDMGKRRQALSFVNKAIKLAKRLKLHNLIIKAKINEYRIKGKRHKEELVGLLSENLNDNNKAEIFFMLFELTGCTQYRKEALCLYKKLYALSGKRHYKQRLEAINT